MRLDVAPSISGSNHSHQASTALTQLPDHMVPRGDAERNPEAGCEYSPFWGNRWQECRSADLSHTEYFD